MCRSSHFPTHNLMQARDVIELKKSTYYNLLGSNTNPKGNDGQGTAGKLFKNKFNVSDIRAVARTLIGGGGGCILIYSCFARQISFQIDQFEFDLKRNSSGRT